MNVSILIAYVLHMFVPAAQGIRKRMLDPLKLKIVSQKFGAVVWILGPEPHHSKRNECS